MALWRFLGLGHRGDTRAAEEVASVRKIVDALDSMDAVAARYLARFAYVLGRVARADMTVSPDETRTMERIVRERSGLSESQAVIAVQIAKSQNALFGGTDDYLVTREFSAAATREQKLALLDCCFAVSAADQAISGEEEGELRKIATELGLSHADLVTQRAAYRDYLSVLKRR